MSRHRTVQTVRFPTRETSPPVKQTSCGEQDAQYRGDVGEDRFRVHGQIGAVIIGADEAKRGVVAVKFLRTEQPQCEVRREEIAAWLRTRKDEAPT